MSINTSIRYSIAPHGPSLFEDPDPDCFYWAVYDNQSSRYVEGWLTYSEAQDYVSELLGEKPEPEPEPFDGDYAHADHFGRLLRNLKVAS